MPKTQVGLEHGIAKVGFEHYRPVLEQVLTLLQPQSKVTLLADQVF